MTTQAEMRAGLVKVLEGIAEIRRVYSYPPETVQDVPAAIVISADGSEQWGSSSAVTDWTWRVVVLCRDAQTPTAIAEVEGFRHLIQSALRRSIKLGGISDVSLSGPSFTETQRFPWAGVEFPGFEVTVPIKVSEAVEFAI